MRKLLMTAALTAAAFSGAPQAQAAPPYCVAVTDSGGTVASACAVGTGCMLYGQVRNGLYCVFWP